MHLKIGILLLCFSFLISCHESERQIDLPEVEKGIIDLTNVNFSNHTSLPLSGDWDFFWGELITPTVSINENPSVFPIQDNITELNPIFLKIGKRWKEIHSGTGFATYQVKIFLPDTSNEEPFAIRFLQTGGAAIEVFVNENLSLSSGKVGKTKEAMIPTRSSGIIVLPYGKKIINLTVHISNFYHDDGSFWYPPKIGKYRDIQNEYIKEITYDSLLTGALFFMAFYHFLLFFFRRNRSLILFFGLFSFITALHSISLNGDILYHLIPNVPYRIAFSLSLIFYLAMPFYLSFLAQLYPNQFNKKFIQIFSSICFGLYIAVILLPTELGSQTTLFGIFFTIAGLLYSILCLIKSTIKKEELALSLLIIQVFLLFSAINDTLNLYGFFQYTLILKYSYLSTVLFQSLILASYFTKTFIKNETLKNELTKLNESLEQEVVARTKEYREAKQIAEEANQWKDKFISLVAHDLRSPLSTVYSALTFTYDEDTPKEEKDHISKQIFVILENAMSTVEHLLNLNRFQIDKGKINLDLTENNVLKSINQVIETFALDLQKKSIQLEITVSDSAKVYADKSILNEIIRNLIANAIKFSHPNGKIEVSFSETSDLSTITFRDYGIGISTEQKSRIFTDPMSSPGTLGEKGFGIGLKLCNELMRLQNGNIRVESGLKQGSLFILEFPKQNKI
ncbi:sensor histidine kinase [Leptospira limi]|uniref:histidine kinase n=1 Tax=Leptospira limi TaxID=2950023 RepID=A0ABT3M140_9LEPT|nr:sensor histidine kinase [Leptospira limi]MCW7463692.1 sensor histidine kinase [Leptospira limi]